MARSGRAYPSRPRFVRPDLGPVYFDNASTSTYEASLSTYNWTHVVGTNANRLLVVGVSTFAAGTVSSITWGAQALTKLRADVNGVYNSEIWYLIAPNTGSGTITVNLSASVTSISGAASWWNVHQTAPFSANAGANGTNTPASGSVTPGSVNNRVFGNIAAQTANDGITNLLRQAPHYQAGGALGTQEGSELGVILGLTATTLQWDGLGALDSWAVSLAAIQPVVPSQSVSAAVTTSAWAVPATTANLKISDGAIGIASWNALAPTVTAVVSVAAAAASASWTGPAASVTSPVSISPSVVSAAWALPSPTIQLNQSITAGVSASAWNVPSVSATVPGTTTGSIWRNPNRRYFR